jgi:sulfide:quinone oxidoreductase
MNRGKFIELENGVFVSGQLTGADMAEALRLGIRSIVSNRPDEESADHLSNEDIGKAARDLGIVFRSRPVWAFEVTDEEAVRDFGQSMASLPGPILFYCRSGRRSTFLWAQAALARLGLEVVLQIAAHSGQDRDELSAILSERTEPLAA